VLGNIGLVRRIASFIPDKERGEEEEDCLYDSDGEAMSEGGGSEE
jgi:hypothetical protein